MPHANLAEADRPERAKACAHGHDGHVHGHADENADGHGRSESCGHDHAHSHTESACCGPAHAAAAPVKLPQSEAVGSDLRTSIRIMQMDCPTEEALIRKKFSRMPSVRSMDFNLMQRVLTVVHAPDALETILAAIRSLDFTPELADANPDTAAAAPGAPSKPWWPLALAGIAAVGSEAAGWLGAPVWLAAGLALLAIASCGLTTYKKGWV
ncbi:MAG: cation transporter, partial [Paraburkholderia nemoris]